MTLSDYTCTIVINGSRARRRVRAPGPEAAQQRLEAEGAVVLGVRACIEIPTFTSGRADALDFARVMSSMLTAGTPLSEALRTTRDFVRPSFAPVVEDILHQVTAGAALGTALTAHSRSFPPVVASMIDAGEQSASLAEAFHRVVAHTEREAAFRARLLSASIYPLILAVAGTGTLVLMVLFVLPRFAELIVSSGGRLPGLATLLVDGAEFVRRHKLLLATASAVSMFMIVAAIRLPGPRSAISRFSFSIPLFGSIRAAATAALFLRNAGTLAAGGVPIVRVLDRSAHSFSDPFVRLLITEARDAVRAGRPLAEGAAAMRILPPVAVRFVAAGERSGDLPGHMLRAAAILEEDVERRLGRLLGLLEPALILLFGFIIGLTALALLQSVYGLHAGTFR